MVVEKNRGISVEFDLEKKKCLVRKISNKKWPESVAGESELWHAIKLALIEQGHDVIKKQMWKDDHLVDENVYYIRQRKWQWCFWDPNHVVFLTERLNYYKEINLTIEDWRDEKQR